MRILLTAVWLLALLGLIPTRAASPTLTNFNAVHFRLDASGAPTNVVKTRLSAQNFDQSGENWTITNVAGATGASLWSNVSGAYRPNQLQSSLVGTNIQSAQTLRTLGGWITEASLTTNLVAGLNQLNPFNASLILIGGASSDPAASSITLAAGDGPGSHIWIENFVAGNGFHITNGTRLWDDPTKQILLPGGDWYPTVPGETLALMHDQHGDWVEQGRALAQTNVFNNLIVTNITIQQNFTIKGNSTVTISTNIYVTNGGSIFISGTNVAMINPTDGFMPYRTGTNSFGDSPFYRLSGTALGWSSTNRALGIDVTNANASFGPLTLNAITSGGNSAFGHRAMEGAAPGTVTESTAIGEFSLWSLTTGDLNTGVGARAGQSLTTGSRNFFGGYSAGFSGTTSSDNVGIGYDSLYYLHAGQDRNTALGANSMSGASGIGVGRDNTGVGYAAGQARSDGNVITNRFNSVFVGAYAAGALGSDSSLTNVLVLGYDTGATNNNQATIGNATNYYVFPGSEATFVGILSSVKAFQSYQGALTHSSTVTLDFDAPVTANSISLTGNLTIAFANLATNRTYRLKIEQPQATNCTVSLPSGTQGYFATILSNGWHMLSAEAWGTTASNVWVSTSSNGRY